LIGLLGLAGCYSGLNLAGEGEPAPDEEGGADTAGGGETELEPVCDVPRPGPAPIRRLTRLEYNNTVRALLGDDTRLADGFVGEHVISGFDNNAEGAWMSRLLAEQYEAAAEKLAIAAAADLDALLGCEPQTDGQACVRDFLEGFVPRAFRRPSTPSEIDRLVDFYEEQAAAADPQIAVRLLLTAMLQSPHFLYRVEEGDPSRDVEGAIALTDYEIASRLSYLLWNSMPDDALFEAAAAGELSTPEQIAAQAERMLDDQKAANVLADFHEQWLTTRSDLPTGLVEIEPLIREEARLFVSRVVLEEDALLSTLINADFTYLNAELAEHYGVEVPGLTEVFEKVELDGTKRAGLLTQALVLAVNAEEHESSPIMRGRFVREQLLCHHLPPPPPDVMLDPPDPDPNKTTRDRYAEHREDPACGGCHALIDPIGFAFEHYDQLGRWRDHENGLSIDASGEIVGAGEEMLNVSFDGAVELAGLLAHSKQVQECATINWFRYAYGRAETEHDECTIEHLSQTFVDSGGDIRELLLQLTQTDAFRFRPALGD
jgi:hypothetical protein